MWQAWQTEMNAACIVGLALLLGACSGGDPDRPEQARVSYLEAPIVYRSGDPAGTFFSTVGDLTPRRINDIYTSHRFDLSPSRHRVLQTDFDGSLVVYGVAENGPELARLESPGEFLGWDGDETLLFATYQSKGLMRITLGVGSSQLPFPSWVRHDSLFPRASALAPDGKAAAFLVWTDDGSVASEGLAVFVMDTSSGALLATWPVTADIFPGGLLWAEDGTIVYSPIKRAMISTLTLGATALSEPIELPFQPCAVIRWIEPDLLHMTESVVEGDSSVCRNSWLVDTHGDNLVERTSPPPFAISPDQRKILFFDTAGGIVLSNPDGSDATLLPELAQKYTVTW